MGTRGALDQGMKAIHDDILRLISLVNQAVERAVQAFADDDTQLAHEVVAGDDVIDALHHQLEENIIAILALQQPMASDLRRLIADLLITNELERMGDYAEGIGRTTLRRAGEPQLQIPPPLVDMRQKMTEMIADVMDAYVEESPEKAKEVARHDDDLDDLYKQAFRLVVAQMGSGDLPVEEGTYLIWMAHNLERIGDRVTNICERIIYARTGEIGGLNPKGEQQS